MYTWVHRLLKVKHARKPNTWCNKYSSHLSAVVVHIRLQEAHHQFTDGTQVLFGHLFVSRRNRMGMSSSNTSSIVLINAS